MPEFLVLGGAFRKFTQQIIEHADGLAPEFRMFFIGIGEDLLNWYRGIFVEGDATDVHWLDNCLMINLNQVTDLLKLRP